MNESENPVRIESGLKDWQILQQSQDGTATFQLKGSWNTIIERKSPEVRIRICREGSFTAVGRAFDRVLAKTKVDRTRRGKEKGRFGTWSITIKDLPAGGPYRLETSIGDKGDAIEWRREGTPIHFFGVGDVWLIAGQSNAEGYGRSPAEDFPELGVHQFIDGKWAIASHGSRHHPWLSFAKTLKRELGYPIAIIPTAVGGTPISRWVPGKGGDLFQRMKDSVMLTGAKLRGVIWYQGESDTHEKLPRFYAKQFTRFAGGVRKFAKNPSLPIITFQLSRVLGNQNGGEGWNSIRETQRQLSHDLEHVHLLPAFDSILCDGIHHGAQGNITLGQRAADTALGGIFGRDIPFKHPECSKIKKISDCRLRLEFENIEYRIDFGLRGQGDWPFSVKDEMGDVEIQEIIHTDKNQTELILSRKMIGRITVVGAPGTCPTFDLPKDMSGYRMMLGFTMKVI